MKFFLLVLFLFVIPTPLPAQKRGVEITYFKKVSCEMDSDNNYSIRNRIIEQSMKDDKVFLKLGFWTICCDTFKASAKIENEILKLSVKDVGEPKECSCFSYFNFNIKLNGHSFAEVIFNNEKIKISKERYDVYAVKYDVVKGDTVNRTDKYGVRQGKWVGDWKNTNNLFGERYGLYKNGMLMSIVQFYSFGQKKSEIIKEKLIRRNSDGKEYLEYNDFNLYREYYENGKIKMYCYSDKYGENYKDGICKEYGADGDLVYDGKYRHK
jgi:hypothetical protein